MWIYQIKTHTVEQSNDLTEKLRLLGFLVSYKGIAIKKPIVILINDNKFISFNWDFECEEDYGKQLDYTLVADLEFLKQHGVDLNAPAILPVKKYPYTQITDIEEGDIYCGKIFSTILILKHWDGKFSILGCDNSLITYSALQEVSKDVVINYLNKGKAVLIKNINIQIEKSLKYCQNEFDSDNK